jgi:hypothetical protein
LVGLGHLVLGGWGGVGWLSLVDADMTLPTAGSFTMQVRQLSKAYKWN